MVHIYIFFIDHFSIIKYQKRNNLKERGGGGYVALPVEDRLQFIIMNKEPEATGDFTSEINKQRSWATLQNF